MRLRVARKIAARWGINPRRGGWPRRLRLSVPLPSWRLATRKVARQVCRRRGGHLPPVLDGDRLMQWARCPRCKSRSTRVETYGMSPREWAECQERSAVFWGEPGFRRPGRDRDSPVPLTRGARSRQHRRE